MVRRFSTSKSWSFTRFIITENIQLSFRDFCVWYQRFDTILSKKCNYTLASRKAQKRQTDRLQNINRRKKKDQTTQISRHKQIGFQPKQFMYLTRTRTGMVFHNQRAMSMPRHHATKSVSSSKCFIVPLFYSNVSWRNADSITTQIIFIPKSLQTPPA